MRPEDDGSDNRRGKGRHKNRSGRDIFRVAHEWMKFGGRYVGQEFEGGVKSFGCPNNGNRQDDPTPISRGDPKEKAGGKDNGRGSDVNPGVMLAADHPPKARDRVAEAAKASRKLKWRGRGCVFRGGIVLHGIGVVVSETQEINPMKEAIMLNASRVYWKQDQATF